jgi:hypothetical protein
MKKPLPRLESDEEAERFVAEADLTDYDLSGLRMVQFESSPKVSASTYGCRNGFSTPSRPPPPMLAFPISATSGKLSRRLFNEPVRTHSPNYGHLI